MPSPSATPCVAYNRFQWTLGSRGQVDIRTVQVHIVAILRGSSEASRKPEASFIRAPISQLICARTQHARVRSIIKQPMVRASLTTSSIGGAKVVPPAGEGRQARRSGAGWSRAARHFLNGAQTRLALSIRLQRRSKREDRASAVSSMHA